MADPMTSKLATQVMTKALENSATEIFIFIKDKNKGPEVAKEIRAKLDLAYPGKYMAKAWQEAGAALQVDATTLLGDTRRAERARAVVEAGHAAIIASDNHGDLRNLSAAVEWLESHGARTQAQLLASVNPRAMLEDGDLEPVPPVRFRRSWYTTLKAFVIGGKEA